MLRSITISLLLLLITVLPGISQTQDTDQIANSIQEKYESVTSFEANFEQTQTRAAIGIATNFSGHIWFKKPSLVRWETREPEEARETIVVGPDHVWDYLEDLNTASKMPVPQLLSSKTLLRFISGQANLTEDFLLQGVWDGDEKLKNHWKDSGLMLFRLVPHKPESGMMLAYIGVEPQTYLLKRIMTVDYQGNANELYMRKIDLDLEIDDDVFTFTPPKGAIINDSTQEEQGTE